MVKLIAIEIRIDFHTVFWMACCRPDYFKRCPQTKRKQNSIFEQINNKHFNENNILQGKI